MQEINKRDINDVLKEVDEYFNSDRHKELWEALFPKKLTFFQRIVAFVKNSE